MAAKGNLRAVLNVFQEESSRHGLRGVLGVSAFDSVHSKLLEVQQSRLREMCGSNFDELMEGGSVIGIAYSYPDFAIDTIAVKRGRGFDRDIWNIYARWYAGLNEALNATAERLARETGGIPIPATTGGGGREISHVEEYYGMAVSHRVVAEQAGIGWRGRNELIVNPRYGCAIRLASVATPLPIERTAETYEGCGDCRSCLDACAFLREKDALENYREQCRRYIISLGLDDMVCGKCIKACASSAVLKSVRGREARPSNGPVYYT